MIDYKYTLISTILLIKYNKYTKNIKYNKYKYLIN